MTPRRLSFPQDMSARAPHPPIAVLIFPASEDRIVKYQDTCGPLAVESPHGPVSHLQSLAPDGRFGVTTSRADLHTERRLYKYACLPPSWFYDNQGARTTYRST